jgi:hypothetical protein
LGSSTATRRAVRWLLRGAPEAWEVGAFVAFWVELEESLAPIEGSCDKRIAMTNRIACYMTKDVSISTTSRHQVLLLGPVNVVILSKPLLAFLSFTSSRIYGIELA